MKTVEIECSYCGKKSNKRAAEIKRRRGKGKTEFYCNRSCHGKVNAHHIIVARGPTDGLDPGNRRDEYTPFKWYLRRCKDRENQKWPNPKKCDLTLYDLKELWLSQDGKCPFTGCELTLREFNDKRRSIPYDASLDRIDNSKGYIKGNVRFVSLMFNLARQSWSDNDVVMFCRDVTEEWFGGSDV